MRQQARPAEGINELTQGINPEQVKNRGDQIGRTESITAPVKKESEGLPYETIAGWKGIEQLDNLDPGHALVLRRAEGGALNLESMDLP